MSPGLQEEVRLVEASSEVLSAEASCFDRSRYELQFFKTKQCSFYAKGKCTRGDFCKYAHGYVELCVRPDLTNTSLCRTWAATGVCSNPLCKFAHNSQQLRATDRFYKTALCKFYMTNACRLGEECRHAHGNEELRPTPAALPAPLNVPEGSGRSKRRRQKPRGPPGLAPLAPFCDETYADPHWQFLLQHAAAMYLEETLPLPYGFMHEAPEVPAKVCLESVSASAPAKVYPQSLSAVSTFDGLPWIPDPDMLGGGSTCGSDDNDADARRSADQHKVP
eukprot:TRINITY_DN50643_c0_g1_i1.p1 TRINITY_DN50643_c0_g1~~TRINITY_DN50643_c0_g1_i1.p1  ORF type:complete len:278 (+),score=41.34 TRINITY_DN50643_c0_g1_i1:44-877(+)